MRTLDRYIVRSFVSAAVLALVALMLLRILSDLFFNMDEFVEHGAFRDVLHGMLSYYGYHVFEYFSQLGGIIIVVAAVFSVFRMNHTNELTAMLASGISLHRVIWPIVLCSMLLGGLIIIDQEVVLPRIAPKLILQRDGSDKRIGEEFAVGLVTDKYHTVWNSPTFHQDEDARGGTISRMLRPVYIVRDRNEKVALAKAYSMGWGSPAKLNGEPGWRMTAATLSRMTPGGAAYDINPTSDAVYTSVSGPTILEHAKHAILEAGGELPPEGLRYNLVGWPMISDPAYEMEITADKIRFLPDEPEANRKYTLINPRFSFYVTTETDGRRRIGTFTAAQAQWVPAGDAGPSHWALADGALFMPSDLTSEELLMQQSDKWMVYMSTAQLTKLLSTGKATDPEGAKMTRNIRFADPVNNLVMLLLGLPFILSRERNIKASALMCVIMVGAFFAFTYVCRYTQIGPYGAAFLPVLLFGPIAVVMLDAVKT